MLRFAAVGAVNTVAYVLLYTALRPPAGPQAADAPALPACALAGTSPGRPTASARRVPAQGSETLTARARRS
ncbi:hypothetical protein GCM10010269_37560 [Streptomyces humidus]|uniref:Uncharacterized protein n=1 Tax=Streptomyces humidus TaxID=52259 RepID=A0A918FWK6_9ACTN|nr:hypothetical protein GCM10010269_37560 [Streptomyces humidus]